MRMFRAVANFLESLLGRFRLLRYDDFTIADYFRKQGAHIGDNCRILIRSLGTEPYLVRIGNHCTIAGDVAFLTHDGAAWVFTEELPKLQRFGTIEILDNCFIGYGAILMPNVRIGPNSVVGAGAIVTKDVSSNTVVAGAPAKPICALEEYKRKLLTAWQMQQPPGYMTDLHDDVRYTPADIQKEKTQYAILLRKHLQHVLWSSSSSHDSRPAPSSQPSHVSASTTTAALTRDPYHSVAVHDQAIGKDRLSE